MIWEIFSVGEEPYEHPVKKTVDDVIKGFRLSCPADISNVAWCKNFFRDFVAAKCWAKNIKERCTFEDLRIEFERISENLEEEALPVRVRYIEFGIPVFNWMGLETKK